MKYLWKEKVCKNEKMVEILLAGIVLVLAVILLFKSGDTRIASVDMDRIVSSHPAMQEAIIIFQKEISDRQRQLNKMNNKEKQENQQKMQQEISQIAMRLQKEAMDKIIKDIEKIANKKGYRVVMDKNAVITGGKDITDEVLAILRQQQRKTAEQEKLDVSEMPMIPVK